MGRNTNTGVVEVVSQSKFATPEQLDQAIIDLVGGAPGALNTLIELASALNNDANFGATIVNSLATKAPITHSFLLYDRSNLTAGGFNADNLVTTAAGAVKWIDGNSGNSNIPLTAGMIEQVEPLLSTTVAGKYRVQKFYSASRFFIRTQNNGTWQPWREVSTVAV